MSVNVLTASMSVDVLTDLSKLPFVNFYLNPFSGFCFLVLNICLGIFRKTFMECPCFFAMVANDRLFIGSSSMLAFSQTHWLFSIIGLYLQTFDRFL